MTRHDRIDRQAAYAVAAQDAAAVMKKEGLLEWLADDAGCPDVMRLAALTEELGEVARAVHDHDRDGLADELAQLAGVALAWRSAVTA